MTVRGGPANGRLRILAVMVGLALWSAVSAGSVQAADHGDALIRAFGCVKCHGADGVGVKPEIPNLAGQDRRYIVEQLKRFRQPAAVLPAMLWSAYRSHHVMSPKAEPLSDADIDALAGYFSALTCAVPAAPEPPAKPALAGRCIRCHGEASGGGLAAVPSLFGQKPDYLARQLHLFRATAHRQASEADTARRFHPTMDLEAAVLDDGAIAELAAYFSARGCR